MSENKKKVIKVEKLVIEADEVVIRSNETHRDHNKDHNRNHRDPFDPWFGGRRRRKGAEHGMESSGRVRGRERHESREKHARQESHESSGLGPESSGMKNESPERRRRRLW